jgi:hypothetical protein
MKWPIKELLFRAFKIIASIIILLLAITFLLFKIRPDLYETGHDHKHCMTQIALSLKQYASEHEGKFPYQASGYGDALLMLDDKYLPVGNGDMYTGHGYDGSVFVEASKTKAHVPDEKCGRVYIQGLTEDSDSDIVLLFDKLPSARVREVFFIGGNSKWIANKDWNHFATSQIELLEKNGILKETAIAYYKETLNQK